jgi:hypothetical protein
LSRKEIWSHKEKGDETFDFADMRVALIFAWWGEALWVERLETSGPHKKTMRAALIGDGLWVGSGLI